MARTAPMNPAPVGKPSISTRDSVKSMGQAMPLGGHGVEYAQVSAPTSTSAKSGAVAKQKGKFSMSPTPGDGYRQESSHG